jgi:hypothetical protein
MNPPPHTALESRIRDALAHQGAALQPPDVHPDDVLVRTLGRTPTRSRAPRLLLAAAAVALVAAGGIAIAAHRGDAPAAGSESPGGTAFHWVTSTVQFQAASVEVDAAGRTFVPPQDTQVHSDPGTPNQYTTLELEWTDGGTPMRIYVYFDSNGSDWWASEIRTYDGSLGGEWVVQTGQWFRSPLRAAFQGDLDAGPLHIHGLTLKVFAEPAKCDTADAPMVLVPTETSITVPGGPVSGYATAVRLLDRATCQPVDVSAVRVDVTVDDPTIVELVDDGTPQMPKGDIRVNMHTLKAGATKVHVRALDPTTGVLIDEAVIDVTAT